MEQSCPACGKVLRIRDDLAGTSGSCTACGMKFVAGSLPYDPNITIQIRRRAIWPWVLMTGAALLVATGATFAAFNLTRGSAVTATPVESETPAAAHEPAANIEQVAKQPGRYAMELAIYQTQSIDPPQDLVEEFDALLVKAKEQYTRSTEMQIRDAVYQVNGLSAYGRPDINPLTAARMIVDWLPPSVALVGAGETQSSAVGAPTTRTQNVAAQTLAVSNLSVSMAVEAISNKIYDQYNEYVAEQWDAYYAQQDAQVAKAEQREAIRQAQLEAQEQARIARDRAIMEQQRWLDAHSITGQLAGRR